MIDLITRARTGDKQAWDMLVDRYAPLIWSICRKHQLGADAEDISQSVWTQLLDHLGKIRDPADASRLAGCHDPAGVPPPPEHGAEAAGGRVRHGRRGRPG